MFDQVQLLSIGSAAVIDTALLLAILERRNWRYAPVPVLILIAGTWFWHTGGFVELLVIGLSDAWAAHVRTGAMAAMATGVLLMPSAMLHAAWRFRRTGFEPQARPVKRYLAAYAPVLGLVPAAMLLDGSDGRQFVDQLTPLVAPYLVWTGLVNVWAAWTFVRVRAQVPLPRAGEFLAALAGLLVVMTVGKFFLILYARHAWPASVHLWWYFASLGPLLPVLLFAYFVVRFNFMRLMVERTLVYGAIVLAVLLFHQVVVGDLVSGLPPRGRVHFAILEAVAVVAFILLYQPMRQRASEGIRYLMGTRVAATRERTRRLAVQLSERAGQPPEELLEWFLSAAREVLQIEYAAGWLWESGQIRSRSRDAARLADHQVQALADELHGHGLTICTQRSAPSREALDLLQSADAALAVRLIHQRIDGLVLLGRRPRNQEFGDEETNAVLLLAEELAVTLDNSLLQTERLQMERRALISEKLATLGLLAGSIAHEVKNPLSAIKTIATVLAEDLGAHSPHAEDLQVILSEVDRLSASVTQLLSLARPRTGGNGRTSVAEALAATLRLMRHLAGEQGLTIDTEVAEDLPPVRAEEGALREIFVNLLANAFDAAGQGGRVSITCHAHDGQVMVQVRDSGPGIAAEVRRHLFEPLCTTKPSGTGLGLYVVGRRVRDLGGVIDCGAAPEGGTCFTLHLPRGSP